MKELLFIRIKMKKLFLLYGILLVIPFTLHAQANYLSVFGASGTGCGTSTNVVNSTSCSIAPISFTGHPYLNDYAGMYSGAPVDYFKNSAYDQAGDLLFSVNADGIYASTGDEIFNFNSTKTYLIPCGSWTSTYNVTMTEAVSEICIVPVQCKPNSYYVICWCRVSGLIGGSYYNVLRAVEVDILPSFGTSAPISTWYNLTDNLLGQQPD